MTSFTIADTDLEALKGQVVVVTGIPNLPNCNLSTNNLAGASSGIGLATVRRLLQHGAKVFASDLNPLPEPEHSTVPFCKVDVTSWSDQLAMFRAAKAEYGHIEHVFANAGIGGSTYLLDDDKDENGELLPPSLNTVNVNLIGCMYTVKLGIHFMKQNPNGGSLVLTASASSTRHCRRAKHTH
jgi:NAD(P)-dependent dehydrogenase (short-subunit alcohol dehydrogenase family)